MKRLALLALLLLSTSALADSRALFWSWGGNPATITGFKLYCGTATGVYPTAPAATVNATTLTATLSLPAGATQYCVVRAYAAVESANSNELVVIGRPDAPTDLRVTLTLTWNPMTNEVYARVVTVDK